ncbi:MAG: response regulator [Gammaproteobacteria bacterium]|nr:response regulator [Gammaproteobacteria bacterium]
MATFEKLAVLVADDTPFTRDVIRKGLHAAVGQLTFVGVDNGRNAQRSMQDNRFDLLLVDWEMPRMDGLEFIKWVREESEQRNITIVMVSGRSGKEHIVTAIKAGVDGYLIKPFNDAKLIATVVHAFKKRGAPAKSEESPQHERTMLELNFSGKVAHLLLTAITKTSLTGIIKREEYLPPLLAKANLRIMQSQQSYDFEVTVTQLAAHNGNPHADFINLTASFPALNDETSLFLHNYITALKQKNETLR